MLLTLKTRPAGPPPGQFLPPDIYARRRWRQVQFLAEQFWTRWRREYLQSLQPRQKWVEMQRDLCEGDVVLMRDESQHRNDWPLGRVAEVIRSKDGRVRKAKVEVIKDRERKTYLRPIKELVFLKQQQQQLYLHSLETDEKITVKKTECQVTGHL